MRLNVIAAGYINQCFKLFFKISYFDVVQDFAIFFRFREFHILIAFESLDDFQWFRDCRGFLKVSIILTILEDFRNPPAL